MPRHVPASALVERYGFTARHWIRLAAAGKVPGAFQPFGAHGRWVFDLDVVARWWDAQRKQVTEWPTSTSAGRRGGGASSGAGRKFARPSRRDLKASLASVLERG